MSIGTGIAFFGVAVAVAVAFIGTSMTGTITEPVANAICAFGVISSIVVGLTAYHTS